MNMTKKTRAQRDTEVIALAQEIGPGELTAAWREMWADREGWTEEMKTTHVRRKTAVDACIAALAELDDEDRYIVKDRLRDLWDVEEGVLDPSDVSEW
jgi:hypothetical protein